jgi:hypothetical protein
MLFVAALLWHGDKNSGQKMLPAIPDLAATRSLKVEVKALVPGGDGSDRAAQGQGRDLAVV